MKKFITLTFMLALPLLAKAQLQNMDFEQWENNPAEGTSVNKPMAWMITDGFNDGNMCQYPPDTDAQNGDYAIKLGVWYYYVKDAARQTAPINFRPVALNGHYKYTDNTIVGPAGEVTDIAQASIYLTKWNASLNKNDTIGRGTIDLHNSIAYSSFSCPVTYSSDAVPDKVTIYLDASMIKRTENTEGLMCMEGYGCYFTVDNLSLETSSLGLGQFQTANAVRLYPNPAKESVIIADFSGHAELYDMTGKLVLSTPVAGNPIGLEHYQKGIYTLKLTDGSTVTYSKLIKE